MMAKVEILIKLARHNGKIETHQILEPFNLYGNEIDEFIDALKDKTARLRNAFFDTRT